MQRKLFKEMPFGTIVMDPPWSETGGGGRGAQNHYKTHNKKEIFQIVQTSPAWVPAKDSHLWVWTTSTSLPDALWLIWALGYKYKSSAVWVKRKAGKLQIGMGQYTRHCHEMLLLGTHGKAVMPPKNALPPSVLFAERTAHSVKPEKAYDMIERVSPGPYMEMFARRSARSGWAFWGNEVEA